MFSRHWNKKKKKTRSLSLTIVEVHLVQLLRFLLDADGQRQGAVVLLQGAPPPFRNLCLLLLGIGAGAAADRLDWRHAVGRREGRVGGGGGLRGGGGGGAAGWVEAGQRVATRRLLNDGDVRQRGVGDGGEALGEVWRRKVVEFGAGARRRGGGQTGRLGRQSVLSDRVGSAHHALPQVGAHHGGHDLRWKVRLRVQGDAGAVLRAHERGVEVVVRLRLYGRNWREEKQGNREATSHFSFSVRPCPLHHCTTGCQSAST